MARTIETITTGNVSDILGVAPKIGKDWVDDGTLKGRRLPGSQDRRINLVDLIDFMDGYNSPRTRLLRFIEEHGATKDDLKEYGITTITEPIGTKNLHFYPEIPPYPEKPDILTVGDMAKLYNCAPRTASKIIDKTPLFGYRPPFKGRDRRVSVDNFVRLCAQSSTSIPQGLETKTPLLVGYPGRWEEAQRIVYDSASNESVWYRRNGNVQEVSIRYEEDGLYVKLKDGIYDLILLGMSGREKFGEVVHPDHLKEIYSYLKKGIDVLADIKNKNVSQAKKVLESSQRQLNTYFLQEN